LQGHLGDVTSVAFSALPPTPRSPLDPPLERVAGGERGLIISGSSDKTIRLWDIQGNPIGQPLQGHEDRVNTVAFSPDGQLIISGSWDRTVRLWNLQGQPIGQPFQGHEDYVLAVAFSPDGKFIVSGSSDKTIRLWDSQGNPIGQPLRGHTRSVRSVAFSADGQRIISGGGDKTIRLWDMQSNTVGQYFQGQRISVWSVAFHPNGRMIVSGNSDGTLQLRNLQGEPIVQAFSGHTGDVNTVAFSPIPPTSRSPLDPPLERGAGDEGGIIVSGSSDRTVRLWDLQGNPIGQPFRGHESDVTSVAFSPNGQIIASGSWDKTVRLWDLQGNPIGQPFRGHESDVTSVAFNPELRMILSGSRDGTLRLWNLQGQLIGQPLRGHVEGVNAVNFSPDGQFIASGGGDGTIRLWNLQGKPINQPFQGHQRYVNSVAFSPDGQQVISGGGDGTIRLWNLQGQLISQPFQVPESEVLSVAFSPDGQLIVSGNLDGTVRLWQIGGWRKWLQICCDRLRDHPVLKQPQTEEAKQACVTCQKYVWQPQKVEAYQPSTVTQAEEVLPPEREDFRAGLLLDPDDSLISINGLGLSLRWLVLGGLASILLIGGLAISMQSPYITVLCKTLDNCARDREVETSYRQGVEQGEQVLGEVELAQSLVHLQQVRDRLNSIINQLREIPPDAPVYFDAQQSAITYQSKLNQINAQLAKEYQAQQNLIAVVQLTNAVAKQTDAAQTIEQYQAVKKKWESLQQQLKAIPADIFMRDSLTTQLTQINDKINVIDTKIEQLTAQAKRQQQEETARRVATQLTQQQHQRVTTSTKLESLLPANPSSPRSLTPSTPLPQPLPQKSRQNTGPKKPEPKITTRETFSTATLPSPPVHRSPLSETQLDVSIRHANDIAYGLVIAQQKRQIKYGTHAYLKVQTVIRCLRRGKSLEEAIRLSKVPRSSIEQLIKWGQNRPSRKVEG
ncbi:MAG: eIF2A-related protein, partial [Microcystaceae cyanobacterium]